MLRNIYKHIYEQKQDIRLGNINNHMIVFEKECWLNDWTVIWSLYIYKFFFFSFHLLLYFIKKNRCSSNTCFNKALMEVY